MYLYTQANTNIYIHVSTDLTYIHTYVYMHVYVHVYIYEHIYTPTNVPFFFGTYSMAVSLVYLPEKKIYQLSTPNPK